MREAQDRTNAQVNTDFCCRMCRRIAAAVMSAAVVLVLLFSTLYLVEEADHDCTGEDCPICDCMAWCGSFLRQISVDTVVQTASVLLLACGMAETMDLAEGRPVSTLITWKVRLNP